MRALRRVLFGLAVLLAASAGWFAGPSAAQPSGLVIAVIQSSEADGETGRRVLAVEASVFSGDRIITGPVGEAQIRFRDNTRLVVGPNSQMTIDAFVFNDDDTARQVTINAVRGAFRFITGDSPSDAYSINTPTAVIGVRGTEFDVDVEAGTGATRVVNFAGVTRICRREEIADPNDPDRLLPRCIETSDPCGLSVIRTGRDFQHYNDPTDRNRELNWYFRYVRDQSRLLSDFQVNLGSCTSTAYTAPNPGAGGLNPRPPPPPPPPPPPCKYKCGPDKPDKPHKPHHDGKPHDGPHDGWYKPPRRDYPRRSDNEEEETQ